MTTQKQKEKKKKDRERAAKAKVLVQREKLRADRKLYKEEQRREAEAHDIVHGKQMPIVNDPEALAQRESSHAKAVAEKLRNNLQILEALEQEYEAEQAARAETNSKLEAEGHKTMREKMDALHKKALEMTGKAEALAEATEEYAAQHEDEEIVVDLTNSEKIN